MGMYCLALLLAPAPFTTIFHQEPHRTTGHPKHFTDHLEAYLAVSISYK